MGFSPAFYFSPGTVYRIGSYLNCLDQENWSVRNALGFVVYHWLQRRRIFW